MNKYVGYARAAKLPPIPTTIKPLPADANEELVIDKAVVVAGLNIIGEMGYICPTVSVISADKETGEMFGWSLCLGNPDSHTDDTPYHFRTSEKEGVGTAKGTGIPNTMMYFKAEVDTELASLAADPLKLDEVIAYFLPYISDNGPPPPTGKSFAELIAEMPTSSTELEAARLLHQQITSVFDLAKEELTGEWDYWKLFEELNRRLHESGLDFAWKSNPSEPDYNPDLGVVKTIVCGRTVTASIGLSKDRFAGPCAVINITQTSQTSSTQTNLNRPCHRKEAGSDFYFTNSKYPNSLSIGITDRLSK